MGYYEDEDLRGELCDGRIAIITCASIFLATDVQYCFSLTHLLG